MAILKVARLGHPVLREKSSPVPVDEIRQPETQRLIDDLVETMRERKAEMDRRADAFLVLPGGIGTLEEFFEVWTAASLGMHAKPVVVLDPDGHYDPLWAWLADLEKRGFVRREALDTLLLTRTLDEALAAVETGRLP